MLKSVFGKSKKSGLELRDYRDRKFGFILLVRVNLTDFVVSLQNCNSWFLILECLGNSTKLQNS